MKKLLIALFLFIGLTSQGIASQGSGCLPTTGVVSGLSMTQATNDALAALISSNSGNSAPATDCSEAAVLGQVWLDTSASPNALKIYDGVSTWVTVGYVDPSGHQWVPTLGGGADSLASATTTDLGSKGANYLTVSGTTTIVSFGSTAPLGTIKIVRFSSAGLQITYNASSLILPGAASITTQAGDQLIAVALGGGNWIVSAYSRADGTAISSNAAFSGAISFGGQITPTALSADTDDYNPSGLQSATVLRLSSSAPVKITGLTAPTSNAESAVKIIKNVGSFAISLTAKDTASSSANRFNIPIPIYLTPGQSTALIYNNNNGVQNWSPFEKIIPFPIAGSFRKLVITNGSNTQRMAVTADAITVEDSIGMTARPGAVSVVCDLAVSGAGGIDTGSMAANTWYSIWVIFNPTGAGTSSCLLSTSATSPTLPTGYTMKARVGWNRTDSTSPSTTRFNRVTCYGGRCQYVVTASSATQIPPVMANGTAGTYSITSPTLTNISVSNYVPSTAAKITVLVTNTYQGSGSTAHLLVAPSTSWGGTNNGPQGSNGITWVEVNNNDRRSVEAEFLLESTNIAWASDAAGGAVSALGWEDNL